MYKSKLQELCHKQKWALPEYTSVKDGEDHCPLFKASVVVKGATFDSAPACKSSKHAYNEAAKVAFLHFTSEPPTQKSETAKPKIDKEDVQRSNAHPVSDVTIKQGENLDQFKKKLEMYTRMKNLDFPVYDTEKDGAHFRGKVVIGENVFRCEELFKTVEEAENGAAQDALLSLSTDALHENDPRSYKNLLQELTQTEGFLLPMYTTIESNGAHGPTFSSTAEVKGEIFQGAEAKSKKLAEINAAKAAYTVFVERKLFQPGYEALELSPRLGALAISDHQKTNKPEMESYLLCKRFRVFTRMPNTPLPEGVVVLPISENRWTMVSLEFAREKGV